MTKPFYPILVSELSEQDGGGYIAFAPDLYGCIADGDTPEEAVTDALSAIDEWCDEMERLGKDLPAPFSSAAKPLQEREELLAIIERQKKAFRKNRDSLDNLEERFKALRAELDVIVEKVLDAPASSIADPRSSVGWGGVFMVQGSKSELVKRAKSHLAQH